MNITENLRCTDAQRRAILHHKGPAMIIAGPGSGKTFVITHRISHLINDLGVSPDKILVITFTKAAAKEMQQRAALLLQGEALPHFGTFHSVFYNILRQSGMGAGSILTETDRQRIFLNIMEKYDIQTQDPAEFIQRLSGDISCHKVRHALDKESVPGSVDIELFPEILRIYEAELRHMGKTDFDDMIIKTHRMLVRRSDMRRQWSRRFSYLMIDEFQDIDPLQYASVKLLLGPDENLFAVGDDDQSIYSFRGAQPSIMLGFDNDFNGAVRIVLDKNFRSENSVISHSLSLIKNNKNRFDKRVSGVKEKDGLSAVLEFEDIKKEAEYISRYRLAHSGSLAVLSRTRRRCAMLGDLLKKDGHRLIMNNKEGSVLDHFIADDIRSYLKLVSGDLSRKNFLKIMNRPYRYIDRTLVPETVDPEGMAGLFEGRRAQPYLEKMMNDIKAMEHMRPYAAITYIFRVAGYEGYLKEYAKERGIDPGSFEGVKKELLRLSSGYETIEEFLEKGGQAGAETEKERMEEKDHDKEREGKDEDGDDSIRLMTMHASKGLEFDTVFITDVICGNIPYKSARNTEETEEERRLMYVAMTRARKCLFLCVPERDGYKRTLPSDFISQAGFAPAEIPLKKSSI